jgi:hypothetical protein
MSSKLQLLRQLAAKCRKTAAMPNIAPEAASEMLEMAVEYDAFAGIERQLSERRGPSIDII